MRFIDDDFNKAVITTRSVVSQNEEIAIVIYDEDGDWQLFPDSKIYEKEIIVISLEQAIALDDSLKVLPNVKRNSILTKKGDNSQWIVQKK